MTTSPGKEPQPTPFFFFSESKRTIQCVVGKDSYKNTYDHVPSFNK